MIRSVSRLLAAALLLLFAIPACAPVKSGPPVSLPRPTNTLAPARPWNEPTATPDQPHPIVPVVPIAATAVPTPATVIAPPLVSFDMITGQVGWGLTSQRILRTTSGGESWLDVTPAGGLGPEASLSGFFLDTANAWVLVPSPLGFDSGRLLHTGDAGQTWHESETPFSSATLSFSDPQYGWALNASDCTAEACPGNLLATTDGGQTWETIAVITGAAPGSLPLRGTKNGLAFQAPLVGWIGGAQPEEGYAWLFATQDGGRTWQHQELPLSATAGLLSIDPPRFFGSQAVLPVESYGISSSLTFYVSADGGLTWAATTPVETNGLYAIASPQDFFIWNGSVLHASPDGGQTWTIVSPNINLSDLLVQLDFVDSTTGWALAFDAEGQSNLYRTTDGGVTWTRLAGPVTPSPSGS